MPFFAEFVFSKEFVGTVRDVSVWHLAKPWAHWAAAGHVPLRFVVDGGGRRGSDNVTQYARWGQEASLARSLADPSSYRSGRGFICRASGSSQEV